MMMELMGLHVPNSAFVQPGTGLRQALTRAAVHRLAEPAGRKERPLSACVDERAIVNAMIGLMATGGSTNHAIHLPAIARAAGILIDWQDFDDLSAAVPLLARVYPNGSGDVNDFHYAGGIAFVARELGGPVCSTPTSSPPAPTTSPPGPRTRRWTAISWSGARSPKAATTRCCARSPTPSCPTAACGWSRAILAAPRSRPARSIPRAGRSKRPRASSRPGRGAEGVQAGELDRDVVVVVRFQGPRANGMPELHKLTRRWACCRTAATASRWSPTGACRAPAARCRPPSTFRPKRSAAGPLSRLRDGDLVRVSAEEGLLEAVGVDLATREPAPAPPPPRRHGARAVRADARHRRRCRKRGASAMLHAMEAEAFDDA
jgi:phosphogluconate dehydratase